jgi:Ino eighty subunit 1
MASPHKKPVPYYVKRTDGELISRADLQYDLLCNIFSDEHVVFTDPHPTVHGDPANTKVNFRDLYVNTLIRSPRASKVLRDKMLDVPDFATDFAKLALLANVGRINTTMACASLFSPP